MPTYTNQQTLANNILTDIASTVVTSNGSITVYGGSQPTAATIAANWSNYRSSNASCLAHFVTGPTWTYNAGTKTYYNASPLSTTNVFNTGTATWAICWTSVTNWSTFSGAVSLIQLSSTTLPNNGGFTVVPVTSSTGIGVIRMTTDQIVPGTTATVTASGLTVVLG